MPISNLAERVTPLLFVLIWSTGWLVAAYSAPYADPLTFLSLRYVLAVLALALLAFATNAVWPRGRAAVHALVSGVLLHGLYLAGVWVALRQGVPATISGLIAALQPILTAALSPLLTGERISLMRWTGIALGLAGIALVLGPKLMGLDAQALIAAGWPILLNAIGMVSITLGTFYQKRFIATGDLSAVTALQYTAALLVTLPVAWLFEDMQIAWNTTTLIVMAWSVLGLSVGGIGLLAWMIRRGAVSRVAALIYLIPVTVAVEAWILFGETLLPLQLIGMALTVAGVALATRR